MINDRTFLTVSTALTFHSIVRFIAGRLRARFALESLRLRIRQERQQLRSLPDELLQDIGIKREDAVRESERHYLDIPDCRRCE